MKKIIILLYLVITISIAFNSYKDYGISWDEGMQRRTAQINFDYVFKGSKELKTWVDRDYGVVFELPLYVLEKIFKWEKPNGDERNVFINRHIITHLFYIIGGVFLFLLVSQLFNSKMYGILSLFLYILNPRIYAHSFINTKDIPFMVMFIVCFYVFLKFINNRNFKNIFLLAIASALLVNLRILGIIFPVGISIYLLIFDFLDTKSFKLKTTFKHISVFLGFTVLFIYVFWPNLWSNPVNNFIESFQNMAKFRHDTLELTFGEMIKASKDKSYFFKWFYATNPFLYLILGTFGLLFLLISIIKTKFIFLQEKQNRYIALICSFFVFPLTIIVLRNTVLYNGWRQLFFLYPSFIILILFCLFSFKKKKYHNYIVAFLSLYFVFILFNLKKIHPYGTVYFNELISSKKDYRAKNFEFDYWGHSYKEALEEIVAKNNSKEIVIAFSEKIGYVNRKILPFKDRNRILFTDDLKEADYFISNFYIDDIKFKESQRIFKVKRNNSSVISIFKLK